MVESHSPDSQQKSSSSGHDKANLVPYAPSEHSFDRRGKGKFSFAYLLESTTHFHVPSLFIPSYDNARETVLFHYIDGYNWDWNRARDVLQSTGLVRSKTVTYSKPVERSCSMMVEIMDSGSRITWVIALSAIEWNLCSPKKITWLLCASGSSPIK